MHTGWGSRAIAPTRTLLGKLGLSLDLWPLEPLFPITQGMCPASLATTSELSALLVLR